MAIKSVIPYPARKPGEFQRLRGQALGGGSAIRHRVQEPQLRVLRQMGGAHAQGWLRGHRKRRRQRAPGQDARRRAPGKGLLPHVRSCGLFPGGARAGIGRQSGCSRNGRPPKGSPCPVCRWVRRAWKCRMDERRPTTSSSSQRMERQAGSAVTGSDDSLRDHVTGRQLSDHDRLCAEPLADAPAGARARKRVDVIARVRNHILRAIGARAAHRREEITA